MPNRNYLRGRAHEYQVKKELEKDGWLVIRAAGSHGLFDLVAIKQPSNYISHKNGQILLIQCKTGKSYAKWLNEYLHWSGHNYKGEYVVATEIR